MNKHTPGPWTYSTSSDGWCYSINVMQADNATPTPDYSDVCFMTCRGERQAIQEANARLIAAAPDLLETVKRLREMCADFGAKTACDMADAAIFKATGE